jgi:phenylacetate-CoA ligase
MDTLCITPEIDISLLQIYFELAKNNPLYSEFYKGYDLATDAPMLSKNDLIPILKTRFKLQEEKTGVYLVRSGGSTQNPLIFPVDIQENQDQRFAIAKELTGSGFFTPKTIALNIFGYSDMYRTAAIMDDILEKCQATTLALSAHASYSDMQQAANYFKPDFILGTPSKLLYLAQFLEEKNEKLDIQNLFFAGEFLRPGLQKFLQKTLGFQQIYSMYGSAETGIWAWSDYSKRPKLFSVIDGIIVEILEPDAEGYGLIAVTNTFRKRFPVFRYAIGDLGRWVYLDGKPFLELKSRESKSFIVCEQHYDLDELIPFTSEAEAFQIQLSNNDKFQEVVRLLIVQKVPVTEQLIYIQERSTGLKKILHYDDRFMKIEVLLVAATELYTDPNTTKTPAVLDLRR